MNRNEGGLFGSWSWTDTNFHKDDVPDKSYTDPDFTPAYSLEGVPAHRVSQGKLLLNTLQIIVHLPSLIPYVHVGHSKPLYNM